MLDHPRIRDWRPPPDFDEVASQVSGISVFAPRPRQDDVDSVPVSFKCPSCGATTGFDAKAGALACAFCGYVREGGPPPVGRAEGSEFTLEALRLAAHGWGADRKVLSCRSCAAEISLEPGDVATVCPFCASAEVTVAAASAEALRPGYVLPFSVPPDELVRKARAWLGRGWMHPSGLAELASIDRFSAVYLPYWVFDASVDATWKAEVGYDETETYTDGDGDTQTRTTTRWEWKSGRYRSRMEGVTVPGTAKLSKVLLGRVAPKFELTRLRPYDASFLAGHRAQAYDVALPEAWTDGRGVVRQRAESGCRGQTGGNHVRNFEMSASLSDESWKYVLVPVYVSAYRFGGRVWQVMANGQTGDVEGQKPVVWARVWIAIALALSPAVCSGLLGLPLLLVGVGAFFLVLAFVFLILGIVGSVLLYQRAVESEAA